MIPEVPSTGEQKAVNGGALAGVGMCLRDTSSETVTTCVFDLGVAMMALLKKHPT